MCQWRVLCVRVSEEDGLEEHEDWMATKKWAEGQMECRQV